MLREIDTDNADHSAADPQRRPAQIPAPDGPNPVDFPAAPDANDDVDSDARPLSESELDLDAGPGFGRVLQNRNFLTLWLGQVFSQLADKVYLVLMIAIISARFDTPAQSISSWVAAVMIAFTIPAVLFGAVAGVFVDRWRKSRSWCCRTCCGAGWC